MSAPTEEEVAAVARGLTANQRDCLFHTLGLNQGRPCERNYFCAGPGSDDDAALAALATVGVTDCYSGPREHMPYNMYRATPLGAAVASYLARTQAETP